MNSTFAIAAQVTQAVRPPAAFLRVSVVLACACLAAAFGAASPVAADEDPWGGVRLFDASLSAGNQTVLTHSDGEGHAKISFNIDTMEITWEIQYDKLTSSPTGIHLHGPAQPGTNAVAIIDLGGNGLQSPIRGTLRVSDGHVNYMLLGWTYVLLKTAEHPEGELRGKLDTVPPPDYLEKSHRWGRGDIQ